MTYIRIFVLILIIALLFSGKEKGNAKLDSKPFDSAGLRINETGNELAIIETKLLARNQEVSLR